ncbi:MAG: hypothetical protein K2J73_11205 [Oscillospiraceae bacterium]|nr:hypothetical protein [Oscillospiraceae bacterium]
MTALLIIFGLSVFLFLIFVNMKLSRGMVEAANDKGYCDNDLFIFYICFFLGALGYMYVAALPDLKLREILAEKELRFADAEDM